VEALVERAAQAGLPVELIRTGDTTPLPPLVDRAVHRIVQEALTNAARHAPGTPVTVRVSTTDEVQVTVTNPTTTTPTDTGNDTGTGLAGLSERVRLLGGTLRSGVDDGRFTITARLPREGGA
jgi:signal transduction histidine kinase